MKLLFTAAMIYLVWRYFIAPARQLEAPPPPPPLDQQEEDEFIDYEEVK